MVAMEIVRGFQTIRIISSDGSTSAVFVLERGAVASSILMPNHQGERELLFLHHHFWNKTIDDLPGGWPFCFPVCGRLKRQGRMGAYLYDGKIYTLPIHGFAWQRSWTVASADDDHVVFILRDDAGTHKQYPFSFEVMLHYTVGRGKLMCQQTYANFSDRPMPYYAGFHPYFLTGFPGQGKERTLLQYYPTRRFIYNQDLTDILGETDLFPLPQSVSASVINEQLTQVGQKKEIQLCYPEGDILHLLAEGVEDPQLFSYIQLYTVAEQPFICVEPWMAYPNAMNSIQGVHWLLPGQREQGVLSLWLEGKSPDEVACNREGVG